MKEFKPVLIFLLKFVVVWAVLVWAYNLYLHQYHQDHLPDPYSEYVTTATVQTLQFFGENAYEKTDPKHPWVWIGIDQKWTSYINEGCNAISVMIIFVAFVIAFSTTWKQTSLFVLSGLVVIHFMNIGRIAFLNYLAAYYPQYDQPAHDYLFPAIIYGTIVVLWIVWVRFFALKYNKKADE